MIKPIAPCKDCDDRYVGCHIDCEKYNDFVRKNEIYKAEKLKINAGKNYSKKFKNKRW
jgi:hypothetical protein